MKTTDTKHRLNYKSIQLFILYGLWNGFTWIYQLWLDFTNEPACSEEFQFIIAAEISSL